MTPAGTSNELDVQNEWEENTHTHNIKQSKDQRGKVANRVRGQLNREKDQLNLVLTRGIPPDFHRAPLGQSRVYRVTQLRTDGVICRKSAGTGPVVLKVVPVTTGAAFALP